MEVSSDDFKTLVQGIAEHAAKHYESARAVRSAATSVDDVVDSLKSNLPNDGEGLNATVSKMMEDIVPWLSASTGPRYFGLVTGGVTPAAQLADHLVTIHDQNCCLSTAPTDSIATRVEHCAVGMLLQLFRLDTEVFSGTLTTGATSSNILGMALGRQSVYARLGVDVAEDGLCGAKPVVVFADAPHSSMMKACAVVGIGRTALRMVKLGQIAVVEEEFRRCSEEGKPAICVLGFGEVNTGEFPRRSREIAALCRKYNVWLHIDAAFGIYARCSPQYDELAAGLELADSICGDGHKWLNAPYDVGLFFYRREHRTAMLGVFSQDAAYLDPQTDVQDDNKVHPMNINLENSRRFRALPVWATLHAYGAGGYREIVEANCAFAMFMHEWIRSEREVGDEKYVKGGSELYEVLRPTCALNIVLFRGAKGTRWRNGDEAEMNKVLKERINGTGKLYVTGTVFEGVPALRAAISNWRTNVAADWQKVREGLVEAAL
ncbi:pyridoxal phosphate-dependent transferase [Cladochytrium replicatum]|nr:pyridoxal phosphate-dependent transferase [Cladochytrium replicatum]